MDPAGVNINAVADCVRLFLQIRFLRVSDGQLTVDNQMRCQACMRVRLVVCVAAGSCRWLVISSVGLLYRASSP